MSTCRAPFLEAAASLVIEMDCRDCARFSEGRCLDAKVNPLRWEQAVQVANVFGVRAICTFNDHRERLVKARSMPSAPRRRR